MTFALILSLCALALSVATLIGLRRASRRLDLAKENLRVASDALDRMEGRKRKPVFPQNTFERLGGGRL